MGTQPNILVYHPMQAEAYAQRVRNDGFTSVRAASTTEEAIRYLPETEVILGWKFPAELLNKPMASTVRWFQSTGAGVDDLTSDPVIPENIILTRIVDQFGTYISEYVFTWLLYIVKDVSRMRKAQIERHWDPFISNSLADKTIGVAGIGSIGAEIVRKARAFNMKVYGLSFSGKQASLVDRHFMPVEWRDFVNELDYLVLTLPLTKATYHIINRQILLGMKADASLINVGRGSLINEKELVSVMESGHLHSAILDVFEKEPLPSDHAFYSMKNVFITPHLSGPSTIEGVCRFFTDNIRRYLTNQPLEGLVDRMRGF